MRSIDGVTFLIGRQRAPSSAYRELWILIHELHSILSTWAKCEARGGAAVLATVVDVKASAYRHPGARMLLTPEGERVGSISGGCAEGEVVTTVLATAAAAQVIPISPRSFPRKNAFAIIHSR